MNKIILFTFFQHIHIMITEVFRGGEDMRRRAVRRFGIIVSSIGVGIVLAVLIPFWGWMIAVGGAIICLGWFIMNRFC